MCHFSGSARGRRGRGHCSGFWEPRMAEIVFLDRFQLIILLRVYFLVIAVSSSNASAERGRRALFRYRYRCKKIPLFFEERQSFSFLLLLSFFGKKKSWVSLMPFVAWCPGRAAPPPHPIGCHCILIIYRTHFLHKLNWHGREVLKYESHVGTWIKEQINMNLFWKVLPKRRKTPEVISLRISLLILWLGC